MKFVYALLLTMMVFIVLVQEAVSATRVRDNDQFPSVGLIKYQGSISCAAFIIRHGVLATAKHCFTHHDITSENFDTTKVRILLPKKGGNVDFQNLELTGEDVYKLVLDSGSNDIAYILYNRKKTLDEVDLVKFQLNDQNDVEDGTELFRAGFPQGTDTVFDKVITSGCSFAGNTGFFEATITDPGYEGMLFDTDCPAWFGDSGGPVFSAGKDVEGNDVTIIHGVLSHTFEVDFAGDIMEAAILRDDIGEYVRTSMFSPFSLTKDLEIVFDEEEKLFLDKNTPVEIIVEVDDNIEVVAVKKPSPAPAAAVKHSSSKKRTLAKNDVLFTFFQAFQNLFLSLFGILFNFSGS